jgi:hypothetical protein
MVTMIKRIIIFSIIIVIIVAICAPMGVLTRKLLMLTDVELKQIDGLVLKAVRKQSEQCTVERLSRPEREEMTGSIEQGYFTYKVRCSETEKKVRANWRIENGHVELTSVMPL